MARNLVAFTEPASLSWSEMVEVMETLEPYKGCIESITYNEQGTIIFHVRAPYIQFEIDNAESLAASLALLKVIHENHNVFQQMFTPTTNSEGGNPESFPF